LLGEARTAVQTEEQVTQARRYADLARKRVSEDMDFFDAIMPADALLVELMLSNAVPESRALLARAYVAAGQFVPRSSRQFDSVTNQLRFLATLIRARAQRKDMETAETLEIVAAELTNHASNASPDSGGTQAAPPVASPAPSKPRPPGAAAKKPARKTQARKRSTHDPD
jgi:hypothetical protein